MTEKGAVPSLKCCSPHFGVSGPVLLSARLLRQGHKEEALRLVIDRSRPVMGAAGRAHPQDFPTAGTSSLNALNHLLSVKADSGYH